MSWLCNLAASVRRPCAYPEPLQFGSTTLWEYRFEIRNLACGGSGAEAVSRAQKIPTTGSSGFDSLTQPLTEDYEVGIFLLQLCQLFSLLVMHFSIVLLSAVLGGLCILKRTDVASCRSRVISSSAVLALQIIYSVMCLLHLFVKLPVSLQGRVL